MKKYIALGLIAITGLVAQSCNKDENPNTATAEKGTMKVKMTDAPADYAGLTVEITKVEAYSSQSGWISLNSTTQTVSVLSLSNGTETIVANSQLSAGAYSKLRFTFGSTNSLTLNAAAGGSTFDLSFGSNVNRQVEVEVNESIQTGSTTEILIDFNAAASIASFGNAYIINPVMNEIEDPETGVQGSVNGSSTTNIELSNQQASASTYANVQGNFLIRIPSGTYTMHVHGVSETTHQATEQTVQNVIVVDGQIKNVGTIQL